MQTLLGISARIEKLKQGLERTAANRLSVRQALQVDCLGGSRAHHADRSRRLLENGDLEEGLAAASAIGDERLQRQARGHVSPASFTHGSSAQWVKWFKTGLQSGRLQDCDTFSGQEL